MSFEQGTREYEGKQVGWCKFGDGREFVITETHTANLRERWAIWTLIRTVSKDATNADRPTWMKIRWLMFKQLVRPTAKACVYREVKPSEQP